VKTVAVLGGGTMGGGIAETVRAAAAMEAAVNGADLVIEAVPEDPGAEGRHPRAGVEGDGRHHRHQHLVAADRRARGERRAARALPRRALVQPAGVDAGHRGDQRARDEAGSGEPRGGSAQGGRQAARRGGRPRRLGVYETLERDVGPEFAPPHALREHVEAGRLGTKSGAGFKTYSDEERDRLLLERDRRYAALARLLEA
jgi:hypothetical protein